MSTIKDGGSAFPNKSDGPYYDDMTLRDYFAAKAMQGLLANWQNGSEDASLTSMWAYGQADAMLAAREVQS